MKKLSVYILENQDILINEGWWDKLKSIFGFDSEKVKNTFNDLGDTSRLDFATLQYLAAKTNDKELKKSFEEIGKSAEANKESLIKKIKLEVQRLAKVIKEIDGLDYCLEQYQLLKDLSEELNDEEGKKLADNFKKVIDERWPDDLEKVSKEVENTKKKVEQSGIAKKENGEDKNKVDTSKISAAITKTAKEQGLDNFLAALKTSLGEIKNFENIGDKSKILDEIIQKL